MNTALIGIDVGSTNIKVCSFSLDGELLHKTSIKTPTYFDHDGGAYFKTGELWAAVVILLRETMSELRTLSYVPVSLAVTGMGESYVGVYADDIDEHIVTWFDQHSLSCIPTIREYETDLGREDAVFLETGMEASGIFTLPKLLFEKRKNPVKFDQLQTILSVPGFITYKLSGEKVFDASLASRTMLYSLRNKDWAKEIASSLEINTGILPPIISSGCAIGKIQKSVAEETSLPSDLMICTGGHDHFCGSFASGLMKGSRIVDSSGTAESIHGITSVKLNPFSRFEGFRVGQYVDSDHLYIVGGIVSSGITYDWAARLFAGSTDLDALDCNLLALDLKLKDFLKLPLFLPHLRGSGAPTWDSNSKGMFCGIQEQCTNSDFMLSVIEGLAHEFAYVTNCVLKALKTPVSSVVVTGGGSRNVFWQSLKASSLGLPLEITAVSESTALGAALLAGLGAGIYSDYQQVSSMIGTVKQIVEPNKQLSSFLAERRQVYETLYVQSIPIHLKLKQISDSYTVKEL